MGNNLEKIEVNGVEYTRSDLVDNHEMGEKRIVVTAHGWAFVGRCVEKQDGTIDIFNAKNIRKWGTTKGLGELTTGPKHETVVDDYGTVNATPLFQINVVSGW